MHALWVVLKVLEKKHVHVVRIRQLGIDLNQLLDGLSKVLIWVVRALLPCWNSFSNRYNSWFKHWRWRCCGEGVNYSVGGINNGVGGVGDIVNRVCTRCWLRPLNISMDKRESKSRNVKMNNSKTQESNHYEDEQKSEDECKYDELHFHRMWRCCVTEYAMWASSLLINFDVFNFDV